MKRKILSKIFRKNEDGFTLMELLVAVTITGIIMTGIATAVIQVITVKALSANKMTATKQVENAFHWLIRDVQQCNNATDEDTENPGALVLKWKWADEDHPYYKVVYDIDEATGELYRNYTTYDSWSELLDGSPVFEEQTVVAEYMDTGQVSWTVLDDGGEQTVNMTIAATVGGFKTQDNTRSIPVTPRLSAKSDDVS